MKFRSKSKNEAFWLLVAQGNIFLAAGFGFLYQLIVVHLYGYSAFGYIATIFVVFSAFSITSAGLQATVALDIAGGPQNAARTNRTNASKRLSLRGTTLLSSISFGIVVSIVLLWFPLSGQRELLDAIAIGAYLPIAFMAAIAQGELQGRSRIRSLTLFALILSASKVASIVPPLLVGQESGALLIPCLVASAAIVVAIYFVRHQNQQPMALPIWNPRIWRNAILLSLVWCVSNLPILLLHWVEQNSLVAGEFAVAWTLMSLCILATGAIVLRLLPNLVREAHASAKILRQATIQVMLIASLLAIALGTFAPLVVEAFVGGHSERVVEILRELVWVAIPLATLQALAQTHVIRRERWTIPGLTVVAAIGLLILGKTEAAQQGLIFAAYVCACLSVGVLFPWRAFRFGERSQLGN